MSDTATLLDDLQAKRSDAEARWDTLIDEREEQRATYEAKEDRTEEDTKTFEDGELDFRSQSEELEAEIKALADRCEQQERKEQRRQNASPTVTVTDEPLTYRKDNAVERSYYKDLLATHSELRHLAPRGAGERIERHGKETVHRLEQREAQEQREAEHGIEQAEKEFRTSMGIRGGLTESPFEKRANPSRESGHGGEFVPPLWLVEDDYIAALRAGRTIAPLCRNMPVPPGTDTIKLPKVKLGTEVAPQLADNAGVASRDVETEFVEAPVKTLAGQEDVAIQLIEQSPGQVFDRVVQEDLVADYHLKLEQNVSFGKGENYTTLNAGTIRGLFPGTEWGAGNRKSAKKLSETPLATIIGLNANWSKIAKERFNVQNVHHVINPAFGAYLSSVTDGTEGEKTGRLLIESSAIPSFNAAAITPPENEAEGFFSNTALGPRIYITANIPPIFPQATTAKGEQKSITFASNEAATSLVTSGSEVFSYGLTAKFDDVWFFESDLRTRVLPEVLSGTLQIRFQVYSYISLLVRYGPSLQFCGGTPFKVATGFAEAPKEPTLGGYVF